MSHHGTEREVRCDQIQCIGRREPCRLTMRISQRPPSMMGFSGDLHLVVGISRGRIYRQSIKQSGCTASRLKPVVRVYELHKSIEPEDTYKNGLTHERELLCIPQVSIIHGAHQDIGEEDTDILVNLQPKRVVEAIGTDKVPVEAPTEQSHSLIV